MVSAPVNKSVCTPLLFLVCGMLIGCGGGEGYSGPTGTVTGTVKLDGTPVSGPTKVAFINTEKGFTAVGTTDSSGRFTLSSKGESQIPVGKYQVTVTSSAAEDIDPAAAMEASLSGSGESSSSGSIPSKYASPGSSGLEFEVKEGDGNDFEIPVSSS